MEFDYGVLDAGMSLPSRERGLKQRAFGYSVPFPRSLPSRERGLKQLDCVQDTAQSTVAPLAGAWIETLNFVFYKPLSSRRSPRGSVD